MNIETKTKVLELYQQYKAEDLTKDNRLDRWRNLEPESAELISIIIKSQQTKNMLELGTSNGFSTIWFADALQNTNGHLTSIEIEESRTLLAKNNLEEFNVSHQTTLITADIKDYLTTTQSNFDIIFLDAERKYYVNYWPDLKRLLNKRGSLLVVDNVISHQQEVEELIKIISADSSFSNIIVNIGAGLLFVTRS